jgi:phenylacetate-CoA ligase
LLYLLPEIIEMKRILRAPREKLEGVRRTLFRSQIANIYDNIPYYREFFIKNNLSPGDFNRIEDLKILPVIEKHDIRENPDRFFNENLNKKACFRSLTSGSTGEPFTSYFDKRTWLRKRYMSKLRARFACGMRPGEKVVIFTTEPPEKTELSNNGHLIRDLFLKTTYFSVFDDRDKGLDRLYEIKPENVYGPPGYFFHLARSAKCRKRPAPTFKRIYTSSEFLGESALRFIREVFQAEIFDVYGSTEFKEVAWECERHQGYHINEDEVVCEILNGKEPAQPGEVGDIVLTDLRNHAMPLIRYRIKDRGRMIGQPCSCGRTFSLMQPVAGRASEYILLPDGQELSPYLFTTSIEQCKGLLQYQFIQQNESDLLVYVVLADGAGKEVLGEIKRIVRGITRGAMNILVENTQKISIEENGKFKVVKNMLARMRDSEIETKDR